MSDNAVRARLRDASPEDVDDDVVPPRTRRRAPELLLGLLLVVGGSLTGIVLFQRDWQMLRCDDVTCVSTNARIPTQSLVASTR